MPPTTHPSGAPALVAVDMDGTFLRSDNTHDRPRFGRAHAAMRASGTRFVVASGNQYEQLASFFRGVPDVAFIAENGAMVRAGDHVLHTARLAPSDAARVIAALSERPGLEFLASGPEGAFVPDAASDDFFTRMAFYYPRIRRVTSLSHVQDALYKFCLDDPAGLPAGLAEDLTADLGGVVTPVTSGHGSMDLIIPGCHKAAGLRHLLDRWGITPDRCVAFGDSGNDVELLQLCGVGVAMANASEAALAAANERTLSNDEDGVLDWLERRFS